jgi:hypothetical protein
MPIVRSAVVYSCIWCTAAGVADFYPHTVQKAARPHPSITTVISSAVHHMQLYTTALLMMGIQMPETCRENLWRNKLSVASSWYFASFIYVCISYTIDSTDPFHPSRAPYLKFQGTSDLHSEVSNFQHHTTLHSKRERYPLHIYTFNGEKNYSFHVN